MLHALRRPEVLTTTLAAAGVLMVTMGTRQSLGLFIGPIDASTGLGLGAVSLALAIGQLTWGVVQPVAGGLADRFGSGPVLVGAILLLALGTAVAPWLASGPGLIVAFGLLMAIGSGAGSFAVLIGAAARRLPPASRGPASGIINAGGSFGQFVFAPVVQRLIEGLGWRGALWGMAAMTLAALPLIGRVTGPGQAPSVQPHPDRHEDTGVMRAVRTALRDPNYLLLHAGFFTCGFHIAFLVTHLPGQVNLCGLPASVAGWSLAIIGLANIAGSLYAGWCVSRYRSKYVLAVMYGSRALLIAWYLQMPQTAWTFYLFAAGLGFTWLATVPPTAALVAKLRGLRYLATLFGLTMLSHQIGGFFGAWLGGVTMTRFGDYGWMWYADMLLAALAALVNLPIRESRVVRAEV